MHNLFDQSIQITSLSSISPIYWLSTHMFYFLTIWDVSHNDCFWLWENWFCDLSDFLSLLTIEISYVYWVDILGWAFFWPFFKCWNCCQSQMMTNHHKSLSRFEVITRQVQALVWIQPHIFGEWASPRHLFAPLPLIFGHREFAVANSKPGQSRTFAWGCRVMLWVCPASSFKQYTYAHIWDYCLFWGKRKLSPPRGYFVR